MVIRKARSELLFSPLRFTMPAARCALYVSRLIRILLLHPLQLEYHRIVGVVAAESCFIGVLLFPGNASPVRKQPDHGIEDVEGSGAEV